jgi:hypothetical protein
MHELSPGPKFANFAVGQVALVHPIDEIPQRCRGIV